MNLIQEPLTDLTHWFGDRMQKRIYEFHEGSSSDKNILGLKGSTLCELSKLGIKVPPGFIITSETCKDFFEGNQAMSAHLNDALKSSISNLEKTTGKSFSLTEKSPNTIQPLLLSVRSGAAIDMPSMMDSILNIGVNDFVIQRLVEQSVDPRFAYDVQKRFLQMFGTVVRQVPKEEFLKIVNEEKAHDGVVKDSELSVKSLQNIIHEFKKLVDVPDDPFQQLKVAIESIFGSWMGLRAKKYRELHHISEDLGTAVVVQSMVFGNFSTDSCVGKICTRNPDNGINNIYGEYTCCAEGVESLDENSNYIEELQLHLPNAYSELKTTARVLENYFGDAQDIAFTVQSGELFILEVVKARRSPEASVKIAVDMVLNGQLTERDSLLRVNAEQMNYFLNPIVTQGKVIDDILLGTGLEATTGSVAGKVVFTIKDALEYRADGISTILVRDQSSTEDIEAIEAVNGLLIMHGGVTNAVVELARSFNKTVITGAASCGMSLDLHRECVYDGTGTVCIVKGQDLTLDGPTGRIFKGNVASTPTETQSDFRTLMRWSDKYCRIPIFLGASSWNEVYRALDLRSDGVGLFGIEGLMVDPLRMQELQGYFLADSEKMKFQCLKKLQEFLTEDLRRIFVLLKGKVVSIRLFANSVNSYLPTSEEDFQKIAKRLSMTPASLTAKISTLREDPTFGIRGCRCAILHQDFLAMQIHAISAATFAFDDYSIRTLGIKFLVPMLTSEHELEKIVQLINENTEKIFSEYQGRFDFEIGAIIETPRACLCADKIAKTTGVSFVLFSVDQLTEFVLGVSKSGSGRLFNTYIKEGMIHKDPFKRLDKNGVGSLIAMAVRLIRYGRVIQFPRKEFSTFQIGVFGGQLGHRGTLEYFHNLGVDFMVSSLEQLPVVKVASAQAYISATKVIEPYWSDPFDVPYWL